MTRIYELEARTDIWTGTARAEEKWNKRENRKELVDEVVSERLITTGLLGSIRWWLEVLVRGLGGYPCDPSNTRCIDDEHCVVCELFGCTGWARKFRFDVLDTHTKIQQAKIKRGACFKLRFTPLRPIHDEEWVLLDLTLQIIADYGAIGGKTVFKPTNERPRQRERHHQDFGLIKLVASPHGTPRIKADALRTYVRDTCWHDASPDGMAWASLSNFWSVPGRYLSRQDANTSTFNRVIGRAEPKDNAGNGDSWLAGRRARSRQGNQPPVEAASKKIFSFKETPRTYGFINPSPGNDQVTLNEIRKRLRDAWLCTVVEGEVRSDNQIRLLTGSKILEDLLRAQGAKS